MTYKKIASVAISYSENPIQVYEASNDVIISKIYIFNPSSTDVRVEIFFVDKNDPSEYDSSTGTIITTSTKAIDALIPTADTLEFGNGITLTQGQCIYARCSDAAIIHIFGKVVE